MVNLSLLILSTESFATDEKLIENGLSNSSQEVVVQKTIEDEKLKKIETPLTTPKKTIVPAQLNLKRQSPRSKLRELKRLNVKSQSPKKLTPLKGDENPSIQNTPISSVLAPTRNYSPRTKLKLLRQKLIKKNPNQKTDLKTLTELYKKNKQKKEAMQSREGKGEEDKDETESAISNFSGFTGASKLTDYSTIDIANLSELEEEDFTKFEDEEVGEGGEKTEHFELLTNENMKTLNGLRQKDANNPEEGTILDFSTEFPHINQDKDIEEKRKAEVTSAKGKKEGQDPEESKPQETLQEKTSDLPLEIVPKDGSPGAPNEDDFEKKTTKLLQETGQHDEKLVEANNTKKQQTTPILEDQVSKTDSHKTQEDEVGIPILDNTPKEVKEVKSQKAEEKTFSVSRFLSSFCSTLFNCIKSPFTWLYNCIWGTTPTGEKEPLLEKV